ncbi:paraquat-inducible protein A [Rhizobium deserti]|uniref:Paraquat-inducible protein A n=1 Tax=Rhizobium deserti TaxID=2547961 RepID=A0A4R5UN16_9HYPH|nr:paraquat-inducible protein A [Rhizobium deserti]TDK39276.1 paraquat-inducible protein A [Rhizobium deserti]
MRRFRFAILLALAALFLVFGLFLPIIRFERLYFFNETPSLLELISGLWSQGDIGLCVVVGLFSIVFPIVKLIGLGLQIFVRDGSLVFLRRAMPHLSKWSMMDVMLVAIVVFAAKSSGLAQAAAQPGLWFYAGSTLIAGLLSSLLPTASKT